MKKIIPFLLVLILIIGAIGVNAYETKQHDATVSTISNEQYDLVIIAPNKFASALQPLIDHKNSYNIKTMLKPTDAIYKEYPGRDDAEKIKYFIKDALETWDITYVLLVGGRMGQRPRFYIPGRYVILDDGYTELPYLSDLYYADIYKNGDEFDDWDSNDDDVFAEWGKDELDLEPDVYVGRLPCRYLFEVKIVVEKIIEYETTTYGSSWFNRMTLLGGDTNPGTGGPFEVEGEVICDYVADMMTGFDCTKLYCTDTTLTDHTQLQDAINQGCGFVLYEGHGAQNRLETYDLAGNPVEPFNNKYVPLLKNQGMYPVVMFGCCVTAKFDVTLLNIFNKNRFGNGDYTPEEIGWRLLRRPKGGSIAHIGATSVVWGYSGDLDNNGIPDIVEKGLLGWINVEFFRLFIEEEYKYLGELHWGAIKNYYDTFNVHTNKLDCKNVQEITLLGDPSLRIGGYQ
jgi:hypothetical protein